MKEKCKYCEFVFKTEDERAGHSCKFLEREKSLRNIEGFNAWILYKYWRSLRGKSTTNIETFVQSRYYTIFASLHKFMSSKSIPDSQHYIKYCDKLGLLPNNWCMSVVYIEYLIHYDNTVDPVEQFNTSARTISSLAKAIDCQDNQVLSYLTFQEIAKLVHTKNLSPWYLLFSKTFDYIYTKKLTKSETIVCDSLIKREDWLAKLRNDRDNVGKILKLVKQMSI